MGRPGGFSKLNVVALVVGLSVIGVVVLTQLGGSPSTSPELEELFSHYVPEDAASYGVVRIDELLSGPLGDSIRAHIPKSATETLTKAGVEIDRFRLAVISFGEQGGLLPKSALVALVGDGVDAKAITEAMKGTTGDGPAVGTGPKGALLFGSPESVEEVGARTSPRPASDFEAYRALASSSDLDATLVFFGRVDRDQLGANLLLPMIGEITHSGGSVNVDDDGIAMRVAAKLGSADAAAEAEAALDQMLSMGGMMMPDTDPIAQEALDSASVSSSGDVLGIELSLGAKHLDEIRGAMGDIVKGVRFLAGEDLSALLQDDFTVDAPAAPEVRTIPASAAFAHAARVSALTPPSPVHSESVQRLAWSADGTRLVSADRTVARVWTAQGELVAAYRLPDEILGMTLLGSELVLATSGGLARADVQQAQPRAPIVELEMSDRGRDFDAVAMPRAAGLPVAAAMNEGVLLLPASGEGEPGAPLRWGAPGRTVSVGCVDRSPDGSWLAISRGLSEASPDEWDHDYKHHGVDVWELTRRERTTIAVETQHCAISPDGKWLAASVETDWEEEHDAEGLEIRSVASGQRVKGPKWSGGSADGLVFSPDGQTLAVIRRPLFESAAGLQVVLLATDTWEPRATVSGMLGAVQAVAFSPDSHTLAVAGDDWRIKVVKVRPESP